jgi:beta-lactamase regulating signal transducer with metallopeptidase domain
MTVLLEIALKSVLIAGLALVLLELMKGRSAAERSWVAHIGLLALVIMAFAPLVLPSWNIEIPALASQPSAVEAPVQAAVPATAASPAVQAAPAATPAPAPKASVLASISPVAATSALYAVPAVLLLFITFVALARLIALRARADVLVDGHWLSALARAQRRMGFKHGTALLTSDDLASPISWGLMRPVILLNSRAVEAADEAEAIIAHELAHVARMDWAKLLLARIVTALFWFNPLVWMLAREAHQLREEAADDSVLAADIADTDYAELLVGVARHECPGLLLGAHGVAPSKSSLARRVARVLDVKSVRGPVARSFGFGVFVGAALVAAPLAALTFSPKQPPAAKESLTGGKTGASKPYYVPSEPPADLPHIIAQGVSTSVSTAAAAVARQDVEADVDPDEIAEAQRDAARDMAIDRAKAAAERARETGQIVAEEIRKSHRNVEQTLGITPEYIGAMRSVAPQFARIGTDEFASMKAVGVTPEFARELIASGFPTMTVDDLLSARAVGVTGNYVRQLRAAGVRGDLDDFVQLRAVGVDPAFAQRARKAGYTVLTADDLIELRALGRVQNPHTPVPPGGWGNSPPPPRTGRPAASPPDWKPDPDG